MLLNKLAFLDSFCKELEKIASTIKPLEAGLKNIRKQIRAMGIPIVKHIEHSVVTPIEHSKILKRAIPVLRQGKAIKLKKQIKPLMITTISNKFLHKRQRNVKFRMFKSRQTAKELKETVESAREHGKAFKYLTPDERKMMGRISLWHEKAEAQALRRGIIQPGVAHVNPSVLKREVRILNKIKDKYPGVVAQKIVGRLVEIQVLSPGQRKVWKPVYQKYNKLLAEMVSNPNTSPRFMEVIRKYNELLKKIK